MTRLVCDECDDNFEAESLDAVAKNPVTGEALCPECEQVECRGCHRSLTISDLTSSHKHESDGWVCDTCCKKELPYEFGITFKREYESCHPPTWMETLYPDVTENPEALTRDHWKFRIHVTFRYDGSGFEAIAVDGKRVSDDQ